jgi:hypothetical protein
MTEPPAAFFEASLELIEEEWTEWTERAHADVMRLLPDRDGYEYIDLGPELRIYNKRTGVTFAIFGQACSNGGKQGTHPARIEAYRTVLAPTLFVALQGPTGWGAWCGIPGREPGEDVQLRTRVIKRHEAGAVDDSRAGWDARRMVQLTLLPAYGDRERLDLSVDSPEPAYSPSLF